MANWQTYARDAQLIRSSGFFLRLAGKTQIFTPRKGPHTRMRMSHTMDVLAFAQRVVSSVPLPVLQDIDEALGSATFRCELQDHLWLATAIALGHDLGHTPFGHAGEEALQEVLPGACFHHNWQSVRVLERVEQARCDYGSHDEGMGVSLDVLDGIVNHTCRPDKPISVRAAWLSHTRKPGRLQSNGVPRSAAGLIVTVADEVAQRVSDISDGLRENTLSRRALSFQLPYRSRKTIVKLDTMVEADGGEGRHRESIARLELQATLTDEYLAAVVDLWSVDPLRVMDAALAGRKAERKSGYRDAVRRLFGGMADHDRASQKLIEDEVHTHQKVRRANRICKTVIGDLARACIEEPWLMMDWYWERSGGDDRAIKGERQRHIADYLAAMTDDQAMGKHREYFGSNFD